MTDTDPLSPDSVLQDILARAREAKLRVEAIAPAHDTGAPRFRLELKSFPAARSVVFGIGNRNLEALRKSHFETSVAFSHCEGFCNPSDHFVCFELLALRLPMPFIARRLGLAHSVDQSLFEDQNNEEDTRTGEVDSLRWVIPFRASEVSLALSFRSEPFLDAITEREVQFHPRPKIRLIISELPEGNPAELYESATSIATSLLFHLDTTQDVTMRVSPRRERPIPAIGRGAVRVRPNVALKGIADPDPVSFYMYARASGGLPLVQYLAMYQVLEYYFPMFAEQLRCRRLSQILRDPRFDAFSETDITRAVHSVLGSGNARGPSERQQLQAVLESCVAAPDLLSLIVDDDRLCSAVGRKDGLSRFRINPKNEQTSLITQVAARVYDIRCRIVHAKLSDEDTASPAPLMPYSSEAGEMAEDLHLIRYLAQRAIIANIRPFS